MSSKKKIGIVIVVAVLAITFMTVAFLTTQTNTDYYTQIDNRWVTDIAPHGAMNYKCPARAVWYAGVCPQRPDGGFPPV